MQYLRSSLKQLQISIRAPEHTLKKEKWLPKAAARHMSGTTNANSDIIMARVLGLVRKYDKIDVSKVQQLEDGCFINQTKYTLEILKRFGMDNLKHISTPMSTNSSLDADESGKEIDAKIYRGMIGSLLYLTVSRPDIQFSVGMCARYQSRPTELHLAAVKRIFRYISGTHNLGLWYPASHTLDLTSYTDADYAGCKLDRKSTSGHCQFLGGCLVSWASKKQHSVALSTAEAEYIAVGGCGTQVIWIKHQLQDYQVDLGCTPIYCDNTSAINLAKNPVLHSRTKHIEIRHHFIRDEVSKGSFELIHVGTDHQIADIFTKPLDNEKYTTLRRELGIFKSF